jgi:uncharacterized membrane protein
MLMKAKAVIAFLLCVSCVLLAFSLLTPVHAQQYVQYKIEINSDNSATWKINQTQASSESTINLQDFQQKITDLVSACANMTQREMDLDINSLFIQATYFSDNSNVTKYEYEFTWLNFSMTSGNLVNFGDVFALSGFFNKLFGNGMIEIDFPLTYAVRSAVPEQDSWVNGPSNNGLVWGGTDFFTNANITLVQINGPTQTAENSGNASWQAYVLAVLPVVLTVVLVVIFYVLRAHKRTVIRKAKPISSIPILESEEEKLLNVLRLNGGSQLQAALTEQVRFSKAKTSQLLSALEKKGIVTRYKKGRDKIVTLTEQRKGERR